jgi:hypothetical protein
MCPSPRARVSAFLLTAALALMAAPASAGAATVFGADMSLSPTNSSSIYSITNVIQTGGAADTGAPVSGVLVSVRIRTTGNAGDGVIRVLTQTSHPDASTYGLLNTAPEIPVHVDADATSPGHVTEVLTRRPITAGDRLGWSINDPGAGILEQNADFSVTPGECAFSTGTHTIGMSQDYSTVSCNHNLMLLSGTIEPDADGDGFGDETQDQCPTNAATQGACPPGPVSSTPAPLTTPHKKCKKHTRSASAAKKKCKKRK